MGKVNPQQEAQLVNGEQQLLGFFSEESCLCSVWWLAQQSSCSEMGCHTRSKTYTANMKEVHFTLQEYQKITQIG
jgi:hypothetical protein